MPFELRHTFLEADERDRFRPLASRLAGMGVQRIRLNVRWPTIEPQPGVYDWTDLDAAIDAILETGMQVYVNVIDAPAHALGYCDESGVWTPHPWEGYRAYFPAGAGQVLPTCWNAKVGIVSPTYDTSISAECANPPRVMPASMRGFAVALKTHCGSRVSRFGYGNEMDSEIFFPLWVLVRTKFGGNWEPVTRMIYNDVTRPFSQGIKDADPNAFIEANESATSGMLATTLKIEKEMGDHLIDGITTHGYPDEVSPGFPDGAIAHVTRRDGGLLQYLIDSGAWDGRQWGIGEIGTSDADDPMSVLDYLPVMRHLGAAWVTLMMTWRLFTPESYRKGTYEPNDVYRGIEAQMSRFAAAKHRAVRS